MLDIVPRRHTGDEVVDIQKRSVMFEFWAFAIRSQRNSSASFGDRLKDIAQAREGLCHCQIFAVVNFLLGFKHPFALFSAGWTKCGG